MKILYIGPDSGTCRQRRGALERLGHQLHVVDPLDARRFRPIGLQAWSFKTGAFGLETLVRWFAWSCAAKIGQQRYDLAIVDGGELIGPGLARDLKRAAPALANFNLDNPFVSRDGARWRLARRAMPFYDLFATPREASAAAARRAGVRQVMTIDQAADEVASSRRLDFTAEDHATL